MKRDLVDEVLYAPIEEMYPGLYSGLKSNARKPRGWKFVEGDSLKPFNGVEGFLVRTALIRAEEYEGLSAKPLPTISSARDVTAMCGHLRTADHEEMITICLDSRNHLMALHQTAVGGASGANLILDVLLRVVLLVGARSFILVHNPPGGDPTPSRQDVELTKRVTQASTCIDIPLVDHIIIAGSESYSFIDHGLMGQDT